MQGPSPPECSRLCLGHLLPAPRSPTWSLEDMTVTASGAEMASAGGASRDVASLSPNAASSCFLHMCWPYQP